jgi:hypothetical protein
MAIGSGLGAQLMAAAETTTGTAVTVTKTYEFLDESLKYGITWLDGAGIKAGQTFKRAGRTVQSRFTVSGDLNVEAVDKGLGLLVKHALGATTGPTQIAATTAYRQTHYPGDKTALGLTIQVGRPQPDGTVRAFTYAGCKIVGWEFSCSDNSMAKWKFTVDGWSQATATALASASYLTGMTPFTFKDCSTFKLGGTVSTTSNVTSVSGGVTAATLFKGITITGQTPMATERYGLGSAGIKANQIQNNWSGLTVKLDGEFTSRTEIYDLMIANTTTALEVAFTHGDAGTSNPFKLGFILPACKIKEADPMVKGPDIIGQSVMLEAYDDESGSNPPIQCEIVEVATAL